ncbi:hypothetical protein NL676_005183 [Syzygium grande]|nr:hypothetical protein NL676_005183 [Syzygium grande]
MGATRLLEIKQQRCWHNYGLRDRGRGSSSCYTEEGPNKELKQGRWCEQGKERERRADGNGFGLDGAIGWRPLTDARWLDNGRGHAHGKGGEPRRNKGERGKRPLGEAVGVAVDGGRRWG